MHVYDATRPITQPPRQAPRSQSTHTTTMHVTKTIDGVGDGWTITDSHLSPDNERLAYAVMGSKVYLAKVKEEDPEQIPLDFGDRPTRWNEDSLWGGFRIWSCRFSTDGKEIVAGGSGNVMVYDLVANRRSVKINAHADDVNSCCWADTSSGNVLISASDDSLLKVWYETPDIHQYGVAHYFYRDRRSLGSYPKPSGVLIGHTEGITYVSPKRDGRYLISNGKDQVMLCGTLLVEIGLTVFPDPQVMGPPNDGLKSEVPTGEGQRLRHPRL
jgi:DDB1- and CUL4-associated factor 11